MYEGIKDIYDLLDKRRLKEAFVQLQALGTQANRWNLQGRIEENMTAYGYMLQYAAQGMADPTRAEFYLKTLRTAYELTDELDTALQAKKTSGVYYDCIRTLTMKPAHTYSDLTMMLETYAEDIATANLLYPDARKRKEAISKMTKHHEETLNELFERTWATPHWSEAEAQQANAMLQSLLISTTDKAVLVSAATLAQLRTFDARKLDFLCEAYRHTDPQVNQRAIVGIVLTLVKHAQRISLYPQSVARISLLTEEEEFQNNLHTIQMQLLITRETTKIDKRMREEIIPEMIKNNKHLLRPDMRFDENDEPEEQNPEWDTWRDNSGLEDRIREMGEWQMAGADVYMSSFAQLKHYPFFHRMSNWFRPFDIHPGIGIHTSRVGRSTHHATAPHRTLALLLQLGQVFLCTKHQQLAESHAGSYHPADGTTGHGRRRQPGQDAELNRDETAEKGHQPPISAGLVPVLQTMARTLRGGRHLPMALPVMGGISSARMPDERHRTSKANRQLFDSERILYGCL